MSTGGINIFRHVRLDLPPAQGDNVTFVGVTSSFTASGLELLADTVTRT